MSTAPHQRGTEQGVQDALFDVEHTTRAGDHTAGFRVPVVLATTGITYRQLDYWTRTGLVTSSVATAAGSGSHRLYSFRDILMIRIIKTLIDAGISLQNVRKALSHLADRAVSDLSSLTLFSDGTTVYECRSADDVVDLLAGGQGVFGLAVPGLIRELSATISELPSEQPAVPDELAARRAAKATA